MSSPSRRHASPRGQRPGRDPLAHLPRPLGRSGRLGSTPVRLAVLVVAGLVVSAIVVVGSSILSGPIDPVTDVAGADATARPAATSVPRLARSTEPSPRPTATPDPTATPVPTAAPVDSLTGYVSPLPRGRLTLPFGPSPWGSRIVDGEQFHDGVDLATFCGDRIVAAHAGTVLAAGRKFDKHMGWIGDLTPYLDRLDAKKLWMTLPIVIVIDDGNGYRSIYAHFRETVVKVGDVVEAGQLIGYEGQTGRASGCHLHYGLFNPLETATFGIDPTVVKRMKVPKRQIARVDPLVVLPMHRPRPKPTPSVGPPAVPSGSPVPAPSP